MRNFIIMPSITDRSSESLQRYFTEISPIKLLTQQQESELISQAHRGNQTAFNRLVRANLRIVVTVAKAYAGRGLPLEDLVQEGNIGLMEAVSGFDQQHDCRFLTYAVFHIRKRIIMALQQVGRAIRIPASRHQTLLDMHRVMEHFEQEHQRTPANWELAELLGVDSGDMADLVVVDARMASLDQHLGDDEDSACLADMLESPDSAWADHAAMHESDLEELQAALDTLSRRERTILTMFYGIGMDYPCNLQEIADRIGLSCERVRQLRKQALQKLRRGSHHRQLRAFVA